MNKSNLKDQRGVLGLIEIALIVVLLSGVVFTGWRVQNARQVANQTEQNVETVIKSDEAAAIERAQKLQTIDIDTDGIPECTDNQSPDSDRCETPVQDTDFDNDGQPDSTDVDDDNDGILDENDANDHHDDSQAESESETGTMQEVDDNSSSNQ